MVALASASFMRLKAEIILLYHALQHFGFLHKSLELVQELHTPDLFKVVRLL